MKNKIVVLGGSFNPPTVAHLKLINSREEEENQWDCLTNYFRKMINQIENREMLKDEISNPGM